MLWHQLPAEEVLSSLKSSPKGLSASVVPALQQQYGKNELIEKGRRSRLSILIGQLKDIMIVILAIAAVISFVAGEHIDAYVILAIIIGNALMGYIQENKAEESVQMLRKMTARKAMVTREGKPLEIDSAEIVPGDIIHLEAGNIIPADGRLLEINALKSDESALTGESVTIDKITDPVPEENIPLGDRKNMVFKGTLISNGTAKAVVTSTGMQTEIGKIAGMLEAEERKTPLQKRLYRFSKQLAAGVILICIVVFVLGIQRGEPAFMMFLTALSLAVAALPEALPAVITIALAKGASRMVRQKALIRNLPAVETLGSVTYICTDKTGTLTQNVMHLEKIEAPPDLEELLLHGMTLNHDLKKTEDGKIHGDSTEIALTAYVNEKGISQEDAETKYPREGSVPFDSDRMLMSTLHRDGDKWILFVKGAPVKIMEVLTEKQKDQKEKWLDQNRAWASEGLRVLFFGYKYFDQKPGELKPEDENDIEFLGMTGLIDPPRDEVIDAIRQCKTAGIKIVMITGDQALTADAIARRLEIKEDDGPAPVTGMDLQKFKDHELHREIRNINVYARVSPEQKVHIVEALQEAGEFVAMTGDGVNDAPSLKRSDIGIAMGVTGTDVAKESSDMILLDDHFATIVKAVKEGRRIYENIRKFILYVLSCNAAEILVILCAPFFGLAVPLLPTHILWINLVTDGLPGVALTSEPAEKNIMKLPPHPPDESLFARGIAWRILASGLLMSMVCIFMQAWVDRLGYDVRTQQSFVFTLLCFAQLCNALSVRSSAGLFYRQGQFTNRGLWISILLIFMLQILLIYVPWFQKIFKTTDLNAELIGLLGLGLTVCMTGFELIKFLERKRILKGKSPQHADSPHGLRR